MKRLVNRISVCLCVICSLIAIGTAQRLNAQEPSKSDHSQVPQGSAVTSTPDIRIIDNWTAKAEAIDLGKAFGYETGFGRVEVDSGGTTAGFGLRLTPNTEIKYSHLNFNVDAYFKGSLVGMGGLRSHIFTFKAVQKADKPLVPGRIKLGMEYSLLTNSGLSDINFLSLFAGSNLGTTHVTTGITSYFGKSVDTKYGGFINATWILGDEAEIFMEYSSRDFMKVYQKRYIAGAAQNVGTINTGSVSEDALSIGMKLNVCHGFAGYFKLYDLDSQMKPVLGISATY